MRIIFQDFLNRNSSQQKKGAAADTQNAELSLNKTLLIWASLSYSGALPISGYLGGME